jgi:hypothetical protein
VGNVVESNRCNVLLGDPGYGVGHNHIFIDDSRRRLGDEPDYHTIVMSGGSGNVFRDTVLAGGASFDSVEWGAGDFAIEWTLTVPVTDEGDSPIAGATVTVRDHYAALVFDELTDATGLVAAPVRERLVTESNPIIYTPHALDVTARGHAPAASSVVVDQKTTIKVVLGPD